MTAASALMIPVVAKAAKPVMVSIHAAVRHLFIELLPDPLVLSLPDPVALSLPDPVMLSHDYRTRVLMIIAEEATCWARRRHQALAGHIRSWDATLWPGNT